MTHSEFNPKPVVIWTWWIFLIGSAIHATVAEQWWWIPVWFVAWFGALLSWAAVRAVRDANRERRIQ